MIKTEVRPETTFLEIAGKKTQLTTGGQGPPLLYLHSAGGETEWMPFHELLAQRFTVFLPAHPGFALSEGLDQIDDMGDLVWHYVDLLHELKLTAGVPAIGFSLGGWLAAELAIHRPEMVQGMVLVNSAGLHVEGAPMGELFIDDLDQLRELLFHNPENPAADLALPRELDDPRILNWIRAREATARIGWNPYLHNPKLAGHLHRINCPTLVIAGRHDQVIPVAHGEYYTKHVANARLEVFEDCGHMLPYEEPARFVKSAGDFLAAL